MHRLVEKLGLAQEINARLSLLKVHRPYRESDHVLNIAFNALCGGEVLEDIEHRRNDMAFIEMLGARMIPDPTTAGDFCRRFDTDSIEALSDAINETRLKVWKEQGPSFTKQTARIDADGTLVGTSGECRQGMGLSYKGTWGYHPLLVSYANTGEPLYIVNRSGGRPSAEGAPGILNKAIDLCRRAGHDDILLRGDTAFSMSKHLDGWDADAVRFVFGFIAHPSLKNRADALEEGVYAELVRQANETFATKKRRAKQPRVKEQVVQERGYRNLVLQREDVAEFPYSPGASKRTYRMIVLRKTILEERGQQCLGNADRYFFYITNDQTMSPAEVVHESNQRCKQEKLIGQLKSGVRALRAPINTLHANWAYMVMTSLAWSMKAWFALMLPMSPRWRKRHLGEKQRILHMEFRTFVQGLMLLPIQLVRSGRRLVLRVIAWRPHLPVIFRLLDAL